MKRFFSLLSIPTLVLSSAGCASDSDDSTAPPLVFGECPATLPGVKENRTCTTSAVPLRHDDPKGQQINVLVAHYAATTPSKGQLWLLDGGPGGTGAVYMDETILPYYQQLGYDIFVPQHRGTGHSTPLRCAVPDSVTECGDELVNGWGDALSGFNSVEAGHDVGLLIERASIAKDRVFVLGISYGTYWAQRYLQAYPTQATGVLLDGVLPLNTPLWNSDPFTNDAGLRLLKACGEDSRCKTALGGDPLATAKRVLEKARDATTRCEGGSGFTRDDVSQILTGAMVVDMGNAIPAFLLRLDRCNENDVTQLDYFRKALLQITAAMTNTDWELDNQALGQHVLRTDIMAELESLPLDELKAKRDELFVWAGAISLEATAQLVTEWPVNYKPLDKAVSAAQVPLLISNGGFDVQTPLPWAQDLAEANGTNAWVFPYAGHGVDLSLGTWTGKTTPCSIEIKAQFLEDPEGKIDGSCIAQLPAPDFGAVTTFGREMSLALFGTDEYLPGFAAVDASAGADDSQSTASGATVLNRLSERFRRHPQVVESLRRSKIARSRF